MSARTADHAGGAVALAAALRALGIPCDVESREALALISTRAEHAARWAAPQQRSAVLALARQHGFTHIAVELIADAATAGATLLRD